MESCNQLSTIPLYHTRVTSLPPACVDTLSPGTICAMALYVPSPINTWVLESKHPARLASWCWMANWVFLNPRFDGIERILCLSGIPGANMSVGLQDVTHEAQDFCSRDGVPLDVIEFLSNPLGLLRSDTMLVRYPGGEHVSRSPGCHP